MANWVRLYRAQMLIGLKIEIEYRVAVAIWLFSLLAEPLVYISVWSTIAVLNGGTVGGYTPGQFAAYYLSFVFVRQAASATSPLDFAARIQHGTMSALLLRPVHPLHLMISENIGSKVVPTVLIVPVLVLLVLLLRADFHPQPWALIAFVPVLVLAWLLRFLVQWMLSTLAFFTF